MAEVRKGIQTAKERALLDELEAAVAEFNRLFHQRIVPAVERQDMAGVLELHEQAESLVWTITSLNDRITEALQVRVDEGRETIERIAARSRDQSIAAAVLAVLVAVVLITGYATVSQAVEAMRDGAFDYVEKPFDADKIIATVWKALEHRRLLDKARELVGQPASAYQPRTLVGGSTAWQEVLRLAAAARESDVTVLLMGESGTGKELVARAIHHEGRRAKSRLVPINCGAIPKDLMESELFGHVKGAFSGANEAKRGLIEEAEGGTMFLDEVAEIPPTLQIKLNRALQDGEIRLLR